MILYYNIYCLIGRFLLYNCYQGVAVPYMGTDNICNEIWYADICAVGKVVYMDTIATRHGMC